MRKFPTEVVISITTGRLLCGFSDVHECCEYLVGGPIFTHQFAHRPFVDEIIAGIIAQHPQLKDVDASAVDRTNWREFGTEQAQKFGTTLDIAPFSEAPKNIAASFTEPLKGKEVIVVNP